MALHSGVAEFRDGDYFGPPLNVVAERFVAIGLEEHGTALRTSLWLRDRRG
jgi:hypothetical protein